MPNFSGKLLSKLVILYELDGMDSVEAYAKANNIPIDVCRRMIEDYVLAPAEEALSSGVVPIHWDLQPPDEVTGGPA